MKKLLAIFLLSMISCKTKQKISLVNEWTDKWNVTYRVYKTDIYDRKTKVYIRSVVDTVSSDMEEFRNALLKM